MEPFLRGPYVAPCPGINTSRTKSWGGRPACEWGVILEPSMAREVDWGRERACACPAISKAVCHLLGPVFLLGGWPFLYATARERWLAGPCADVCRATQGSRPGLR